jgi:hypothetical protein
MKDGDEIWKIKDERRKINDLCPGDEKISADSGGRLC